MTDSIIELNGTKKNDVFEITLGEGKVYEIDGKNGGKDTILFNYGDTIESDSFYITQEKDGDTTTKNLKIICKSNNGEDRVTDIILIKDYFTSTEGTTTKSSIKYFETNDGKFLLSDLIYYDGVIEPNKKGVFNGTVFSDEIIGTEYTEDSSGNDKIYGKDGSDYIEGLSGDDTIYGGKGDDEIYGGEGNDKLYADAGSDIFGYTSNNDGHDIIYSANKDDALTFAKEVYDINDFIYIKDGNNLIIGTGEDSSIKLANYFKSKESNALDKILTINNSGDVEKHSLLTSATIEIEGKGKINGTFLNDYITGSDKKDTINAGSGNDFIYAGLGNDKITGGKGSNTIDFVQGDGNDTIYLTKGENLTINYYATDNYSNLNNQFYVYEKGNDVIISRKYFGEYGEEKIDSVTIKNVGKNNLAESIICNVYIDDDLIPRGVPDKNWVHTASFNVLEYIYEIVGFANGNKGATLKGTNLNELFTGTENKDTIKTGGGINIVDAGGGDDYIDSTKGNNTIYIYDNSGNDTILAGKDSETNLVFDGFNAFHFYKNGNDLVVTHEPAAAPADLYEDEEQTADQTVTLKDYFKTDKQDNLLNQNISITNNGYMQDLWDYLEYGQINVTGKENKANKIDLRKYQDTFNFNVTGGDKNDKIYLGAGDHEVHSGAGNDTIIVGNGTNEIYTGEGNDTVKAGNGENSFYYTSGKDVYESGTGYDDYVVEYSSDMNLTIKDNGGTDYLYIENIDQENLHVFLNINKNGDVIVSDNNSANLNNFYIFGSDEDGNSMLSYDNILKGMKGKDMSGVIEIENCFEKSFDTYNEQIEVGGGRGYIENLYVEYNNYYIDTSEITSDVANWLSSYKDGYFESSVDVLSRGGKDDIEAMLAVYNDHNFRDFLPEE